MNPPQFKNVFSRDAVGRLPGDPEPRWRVYGAVLLTVGMWSFAFAGIKRLLDEVSPAEAVMFRYLPVVATFLVGFTALGTWPKVREALRQHPFMLMLLAFLTVPAYQFCLARGETQISPGLASLIIGTNPIMAIVLARFILAERLGPMKIAGMLLSFAGVALVVFWGPERAGFDPEKLLAVGITFLAPLSWVLYTVYSKPVLRGIDSFTFAGIACIFGTLMWIPFTPLSFYPKLPHLSGTAWLMALFLGLGCSVLCQTLWSYCTKHLEAGQVSIFVNLIPCMAVLEDVVVGRLPPTVPLFLGVLAAAGGVLLVNWERIKGVFVPPAVRAS